MATLMGLDCDSLKIGSGLSLPGGNGIVQKHRREISRKEAQAQRKFRFGKM